MLRINHSALEVIRSHGESGYPLEICGFLVGYAEEGVRTIREAWPVRNAWEDDPALRATFVATLEQAPQSASAESWDAHGGERRFLVSPQDILTSMKRAREVGMDLVGVYHTHPNHPAVPSDFDRDAAWPDWSYLILSVRDGTADDCRSWVLDGSGIHFLEEEIVVDRPFPD